MSMWSSRAGGALVLCATLLFAACGGGGSSSGDFQGTGNPDQSLAVVDVSVAGTAGVPVNKIFVFEFSATVDPDTVRPDTIQIREGPNYGKQVPGFFRVDDNRVEFYPRLPVKADLSDAGLQPGRSYRIIIPGYPEESTVTSATGVRVGSTTTLDFETAQLSAAGLFIDNFLDPLPPTILAVNPPDGATEVPADSRIMITFNRRPLNPATVNASNIRLFMESRLGQTLNRLMPIEPTLIQSHDSVQVQVVPVFPLADVATYRLEVDRRVQDLVGNDVEPPSGLSTLTTRFTVRDEPFRTDELVLHFDEAEKHDVQDEAESTASWNEAVEDALAALFTVAGGNGTAGDLSPSGNQNFSPESFKRGVDVVIKDGIEYDVYNFRSISIPQGVTVRFSQRATGPNRPVILLSLKNITIAGTLTVSGGHGEDGEGTQYTTSYIPLARGGTAGPGGGNGSDNDPTDKTGTDYVPMDGQSVPYGGEGGKGGGVGTYSYSYYYGGTYFYRYAYSYCAGGGGGGGSRTAGTNGKDGNYPSSGYYGLGGKGGKSTVQRGYYYNAERTPNVGGGGGGAGGKGYYDYYYYNSGSTSKTQYYGGAGSGGGGGGGITVQSAGDVSIEGTGSILADGGDGGDAMLFYAYAGGAGGGGSGGGVKVVATGQVNLDAGATISVTGGTGGIYGGTYTYYGAGPGGNGGEGYIRFEAIEDENAPGKALVNGVTTARLTYQPPSVGTFAPQGGGAPSIGQTLWMNLGVYDPVMFRPDATDVVATLYNDNMTIEVQMAIEDESALGKPDQSALDIFDADNDGRTDDTTDPSVMSDWTPLAQVESLNGNHYQFIRVRVTFQLDSGQLASHPLPYLDTLRLPFGF